RWEVRMRWVRRLVYWIRFGRRDAELREEMAFHRDQLAESLHERGLPATQAQHAARRAMGNETYMREEARSVWFAPRLEAALQDARHAWRGLARSPAFTAIAAGSLALGIGANAAIFSILHALLLARLPVPTAAELIQLQRDVGRHGTDETFSAAEFHALAGAHLPLTMFSSTFTMVELEGVAANASLDAVDGSYFGLLELGVARGRGLTPIDDDAAAPVAVVTDRFWRTRMNGDSAVLGRTFTVDGHPFTVVGVTPRGFAGLRFPPMADLMIPYRTSVALGIVRGATPSAPTVEIVGRRGASSVDRARRALAPVWAACCASGALFTARRGETVAPSQLAVMDVSRGITLRKLDLRGQYSRILIVLMAAVALLLLAACGNVASLLLARSTARAGELSVRAALGASRWRIVSSVVAEALELALIGGVLGVAVAKLGLVALTRTQLGDLSGVVSPNLSASVLAFTAIVSALSGLVFGLVPALRVMRSELALALNAGARRGTRRRAGVVDRGLVAIQIALALLLVTGAMLLVETFRNLEHIDLGFTPAGPQVTSVETRHTAYQRTGMTVAIADEILRRVRALPGVQSAAFGSWMPIFGGRSSFDNVNVPGAPPLSSNQTDFAGVTPGYFASLGIALREGRDVPPPVHASGTQAVRDVVVNETFARTFFPGRDALGRIFTDADEDDTTATTDRIVGVVADARFLDVRAPPRPMYFVPVADGNWPYLMLVVRPERTGASLGRAIARIIADVAPGIGQGSLQSISTAVDDALVRERIAAGMATLFGVVALGLVAVGLYGVMLYQVTARTKEIGIRMALGASGRLVFALVLRESLAIVGAGVVVGVPLAVLASRAVASQLYGISPYSLPALVLSGAALVLVAIAACIVPMRRAIGIDPLISLRAE
ncbi:MAG TPA: ADOP family duplicated permease, partial [Gemmatimonadaceae bacterium]|nr:ADOP family duplicated permease [Gemmatimonadaceae bacterium]